MLKSRFSLSLILALGFASLLYFPSCNDKEPADPEDHFAKIIWSCDNCNFTDSEVDKNLKLAAKGLSFHAAVSGTTTTHSGGTNQTTVSNSGDNIWFVDNDQALWTAMGQIGGKDAYQYYNTLDGEWSIQLVYIEDQLFGCSF
jgi:hypothetical protein